MLRKESAATNVPGFDGSGAARLSSFAAASAAARSLASATDLDSWANAVAETESVRATATTATRVMTDLPGDNRLGRGCSTTRPRRRQYTVGGLVIGWVAELLGN